MKHKTIIEQILIPYKLKKIKRVNTVDKRQESDAEHIYTMLVLFEHFLPMHPELDAEKIRLMILYHDLPEVYAGDCDFLDTRGREQKREKEAEAAKRLEKELPKTISKKFLTAWEEYEENKTLEARFVHALDALDPLLQAIENREKIGDRGYTEEKLRERKTKYFDEFPLLKEFFDEAIEALKRNRLMKKPEQNHGA